MEDKGASELQPLLLRESGSGSKGLSKKLAVGVLSVNLLAVLCLVTIISSNSNKGTEKVNELLQAESLTESSPGATRRASISPTLKTTLGSLQGLVLQSRAGRDYFGFYNVPYGEPPVGELRFQVRKPYLTLSCPLWKC
jgi:hypothetical protein